jgi:hypothetical protein
MDTSKASSFKAKIQAAMAANTAATVSPSEQAVAVTDKSAPTTPTVAPEQPVTKTEELSSTTESVTENNQPEQHDDIKVAIRKEVEADLRKQFSQIGRREQQLKQQLAEVEALKKAKEMLQSGKKLDAISALGLSYDDLTNEILNSNLLTQSAPQQPSLPPEVQELINWKKQQEVAQSQQIEAQAKEYIKSQAQQLNSEFILAYKGGVDAVYALANQKYIEEGDVDIQQVIQQVEQQLNDEYFSAFVETNKGKSLLDKRYQQYVEQKQNERRQPNTLSSHLSATAIVKDSEGLVPSHKRGTREGLKMGISKALQNNNKK